MYTPTVRRGTQRSWARPPPWELQIHVQQSLTLGFGEPVTGKGRQGGVVDPEVPGHRLPRLDPVGGGPGLQAGHRVVVSGEGRPQALPRREAQLEAAGVVGTRPPH